MNINDSGDRWLSHLARDISLYCEDFVEGFEQQVYCCSKDGWQDAMVSFLIGRNRQAVERMKHLDPDIRSASMLLLSESHPVPSFAAKFLRDLAEKRADEVGLEAEECHYMINYSLLHESDAAEFQEQNKNRWARSYQLKAAAAAATVRLESASLDDDSLAKMADASARRAAMELCSDRHEYSIPAYASEMAAIAAELMKLMEG